MRRSAAIRRQCFVGAATAAIAAAGVAGVTRPASASTAVSTPASAVAASPDLTTAVHYLTTTRGANGVSGGTSLAHDGYYEAFDQFADFGLTLDGAFALAAARTDDATLRKVVDFVADAKTDGSGNSINSWTGIGTAFVSGGSLGKEALLAEITGRDPRHFGGHDLVGALDHSLCSKVDVANGCAGPGNYRNSPSAFSQSLGVMAQLRAGDTAGATRPLAYLESLQNGAGAWPSLLPSSGDSDVDTTAMAAMTLSLVPHDAVASAAVARALGWLAGRQEAGGGFPGVAPASTNSSGLAIQALRLAGAQYSAEITKALAFLAHAQNHDGGFDASADDGQGSNVRASAQVVGGVVGTSFGVLRDVVAPGGSGGGVSAGGTTVPSTTTSTTVAPTTTTLAGTDRITAAPSLPATGAGVARSTSWALGVLLLGLAATCAGRRRRGGR